MSEIPFNGPSIMQKCTDQQIKGDANNYVNTFTAKGHMLCLFSHQANYASIKRIFVLFHPSLSTQIIRSPVTTLKKARVACGFDIDTALFFEEVYLVGPFQPADITPLTITEIVVKEVTPYNPPTKLRKYFEKEFAERIEKFKKQK